MCAATPERVIAYIDGFNLYFGFKSKAYQRYYWLNIQAMAENLVKPYQQLVTTKYFTARISGPEPADESAQARRMEDKRRRQALFLEALDTLSNCSIYYGHYMGNIVSCRGCGRNWPDHEEKMTDVNIATEMLVDSFENKCDSILLISADSDLVPAIRGVKRLFPAKRIVVFFPPGRFSAQLKLVADKQFTIGRGTLAKSQFPDQIIKPDGHVLMRPEKWR
jgi:uncharacterized LabA/DUF88 family protein